jgi:hypothetical protein
MITTTTTTTTAIIMFLFIALLLRTASGFGFACIVVIYQARRTLFFRGIVRSSWSMGGVVRSNCRPLSPGARDRISLYD